MNKYFILIALLFLTQTSYSSQKAIGENPCATDSHLTPVYTLKTTHKNNETKQKEFKNFKKLQTKVLKQKKLCKSESKIMKSALRQLLESEQAGNAGCIIRIINAFSTVRSIKELTRLPNCDHYFYLPKSCVLSKNLSSKQVDNCIKGSVFAFETYFNACSKINISYELKCVKTEVPASTGRLKRSDGTPKGKQTTGSKSLPSNE